MKHLSILFALAVVAAFGDTVPDSYIVELSGPAVRSRGASPEVEARRSVLRIQHASAKHAIEIQGAQVTGETINVVNTLFVTTTAGRQLNLRAIPSAVRIYPVRIRKLLLDHALPLQKVPDAWSQIGGMQNAGAGIKIGIIDTGIDVSHPAFNDSSLTIPPGFPKTNQDSDTAFTNNKIIVARTYNTATRLLTSANDVIGHGTGVAMTAAGAMTVGTYGVITGVAPKAFLGNYKVFPDGQGGAPDQLIVQAIDDAVSDGMDVINLSLGSVPSTRPQDDILVRAIESAVASGVVVTIAGGNDGSDPATISSPATAPDAISVGSSMNDRNFAGTVQVTGGNTLVAISATGPNSPTAISAALVDAAQLDPAGLACGTLPAGSLSGSIVLVLRGVCTFEQKLNDVQQAGAVAAVIYTDGARPDPITMATGTATLPATMVSFSDGSNLKQQIAAGSVSVTVDFALHPFFVDPNRLSNFSSVGPNTDGNIKPDLIAIGQNISTAQPLSMNGGFVVESGTSFSSPMLAGATALLKAARPGLTAQQYRSLLINSASPFVFSSGVTASVQQIGAGLLNMQAALNNSAAAFPVSVNFGAGSSTVDQTNTLTLTNVGTVHDTFSLTATASSVPGVIPAITPSTVDLDPGQSTAIALEFTASGLAPGAYQGVVGIQAGQSTVTARVPYWYGISSGTPSYVTVLGPPSSGTHNTKQTIYFRISDSVGLPVFMDATIAASGGGAVAGIQNLDAEYPGVYAATVRLGPAGGSDTFQITAGSVSTNVIILSN